MTRDEITAHVSKDNKLCKKAIKKIDADWKNLSTKKSSSYMLHKEYEYFSKESNQRYFILYIKSPKFNGIFRSRIAEVKDENRTYYVVCPTNTQFFLNIISSHCLSRFFERMHLTRGSLKEDLSSFMFYCVPSRPIYSEDDKVVLALRDGLALCEKNEEAHKLIYRTFISKELLKQTQREALEKISDEMDLQSSMIRICSNQQQLKAVQMAFSFRSELRKEAEAIYKEYFENKKDGI